MTETSDRYLQGAARFEEVYPQRASTEPTPFERMSMEQLFAEIGARPGLTTREPRLLILGVVAAQGNETILRLQFRSGLAKGDLTEQDLTEIPLFLTQYVGYPLGVVTNSVARKVLGERNA
jgi:4-carboxymuconolactone decarboxylase